MFSNVLVLDSLAGRSQSLEITKKNHKRDLNEKPLDFSKKILYTRKEKIYYNIEEKKKL